jgi:Rieske Fe-S protein
MIASIQTPSRRQVLVAAAVTASIPILNSALPAHAADPAPSTAPDTKPAWKATELKAADLKDNEFTASGIDGVVFSRKDKIITALSTVCTHKGCAVAAKSGANILICPCHAAQFNLDGTVAKAPANKPLERFAIRVNDKGIVEVDKTQKVARDNTSATVTLS